MASQSPSSIRLGWLRACWVFQPAPLSQLTVLAEAAHTRHFARRAEIQRRGSPADHLLVLARGRAKICLPSPDNGSEYLVALATEGSVFGEVAFFDELARASSLIALSDCEVVAVPRRWFAPFLEANPAVASRLLALTTDKLRMSLELIHTNRFLDMSARFYRRLQYLALVDSRVTEEGLRIDHGLAQYDLANSIGASREAFNKLISRWRHEGLVDYGRGYLVVRDGAALARCLPPGSREDSVLGGEIRANPDFFNGGRISPADA